MGADKAAILIVNGGKEPTGGRWLELCLSKIRQHTRWPSYHLYVWNNNSGDPWVTKFLRTFSNVTLVNADAAEQLTHRHAVPLQRLYEIARADLPKYVVTMDTDAHPIRDGWLTELISHLNPQIPIAGVWRDELSENIPPYVHPSCLCTTTEFIQAHRLRFDYLPRDTAVPHDTLSSFTATALTQGLKAHELHRSNRNQIHHLMAGIYGDLIYHHGAGSRPGPRFRGEPRSKALELENRHLREQASAMLFQHYDRYISWLNGSDALVFILGMHRSGTSCLAGLLERCGLYLGDVNRFSKHNRRGNHESKAVNNIHNSILANKGGSWSEPPDQIVINPEHRAALASCVAPLLKHPPAGLKDPRLLLFFDQWRELVGMSTIVGTFRHPLAVARSLARRNQMSLEQGYDLWCDYNRRLVESHMQSGFPLVEYDLGSPGTYLKTVAAIAVKLGLDPNPAEMRRFLSLHLEHEKPDRDSVPSVCQQLYGYLRQHSHQPDEFECRLAEIIATRTRLQHELKKQVALRRVLAKVPFARTGKAFLNRSLAKFRKS